MTVCTKCGFDNPTESRFCASCGESMPVSARCPGCGVDNPSGSKFCRQCGGALGGVVRQFNDTTTQRVSGSTGPGKTGVTQQGLRAEALNTVKTLLGVAVALYLFAAYLNYSSIEALQAYLGPFADTSTSGFLIMLDIVLASLSGYAAFQLDKGEDGLARKAMVANAVTGALTLFLFHNGITEIVMNGGLLALGVWGWRLLGQGRRALI